MSALTGDAATSVPPTRQPPAAGPLAAGPLEAGAAPAATPARLLTAACGLADQIVACGMSSSDEAAAPTLIRGLAAGNTTARGGHVLAAMAPGGSAQTSHGPSRVNWLGLQPVEGIPWMVLPMGAGLADGYLGVALFLAQLGRLTGVGRYVDVARRAVSPLPALLGVLDGRPDLLAMVGCGVADGLAGISYALARMSTLLDDPELGEWAEDAVRLTARLVAMSPATELAAGTSPTRWPPDGHQTTARHTTDGPATRKPASHKPASHKPASHRPASHRPASHRPASGGPASGAAASHKPASGGPASGGPATDGLAADGLAADGPATDGPATDGPAAEGPSLPTGWLDGLAGCLAAMTAVHAELGSAAAGAVARACADQLADLVKQTGGRCVGAGQPVALGFADGPAGIGWALARFGASTAEPAYQEASRRAVSCAVDPVADAGWDGLPGWCAGTAGLLVARSCLGGTGAGNEGGLLTQRPMLTDLSLCHGEAGITEALTMLGPAALAPAAQSSSGRPAGALAGLPPLWRCRAGLIVNAVSRHTRFCGTPGGVPTPGLLRGLAGIGYGLLRAGFTERVPSVLFLEPTPADGQPG